MTYSNVFFLKKKSHALKYLECNSTLLPHLVYAFLCICKWAPPPLIHSLSSEIHWFTRGSDWLQGSL